MEELHEVEKAVAEVIEQREQNNFIVEEWNGSSYQKWAKNFCYKNQWRVVNHIGEYEDCLAECAMAYVDVKLRYEHTVNSSRQFMYIYKLWVAAIFNNYSTKDSRHREAYGTLPQGEQTVSPEANAVAALNDASPELKSVLEILFHAPQEVMEVLRKDADGYSPKQFFNQVLMHLKMPKERSSTLIKELKGLLT